MIKKLIEYPNKETLLREVSKPVDQIDSMVKQLFQDLIDTLHDQEEHAIAAPQIGINKRVIVIHFFDGEDQVSNSEPVVVVNPEIIDQGSEERFYDDCPNMPNFFGFTERPSEFLLRGLDKAGKPISISIKEPNAQYVHHAIDHLDGLLFIDRINDYKKDLFVTYCDRYGRSRFLPYCYTEAYREKETRNRDNDE